MARATRGTGSISQYGNGRYKGIITVGYQIDPVTKTKKRLTKTFTGTTRKEVQTKITEYQYKVNIGKIDPIALPLTFEQYKERWLMLKKQELKPQSYVNYVSMLEHMSFGDTPFRDISVASINSMLLKLLETRTPATVRRYRTVLISIFESARKERVIPENLAKDSMRIKDKQEIVEEGDEVMHVLTQEEARVMIETSKTFTNTPWLYPLIRVALETGMRKGEIRALQYKALHEDTLRINKSISDSAGNNNQVVTPKTKTSIRTIHVSPSLIELLRSMPHESESDFVFRTDKGTPLGKNTIIHYFNALKEACHISKPLHFHDLRHTHATLLIMAGVNIKTVSVRLGHASVAITLNRYTHALPAQDKEASDHITTMLLPATTDKER